MPRRAAIDGSELGGIRGLALAGDRALYAAEATASRIHRLVPAEAH